MKFNTQGKECQHKCLSVVHIPGALQPAKGCDIMAADFLEDKV